MDGKECKIYLRPLNKESEPKDYDILKKDRNKKMETTDLCMDHRLHVPNCF